MVILFLSQNQTLIAIKAPQASSVEVPDPDEVCSSEFIIGPQTFEDVFLTDGFLFI